MITPADSDSSRRFRFFLGGVGTGSLLGGLQVVLYPWLVTGVLGESPTRIGLAQMMALLPALLFILIGGAVSERRHPGKLLLSLYLLYILPYGLLMMLVIQGSLNYGLVVLFGFSYGLITSFVQPARESLLPRVASEQLQRAVARSSLVQFACQSVGILFAGRMDQFGLVALLSCQLLLALTTGHLLLRSYPVSQVLERSGAPGERSRIRDGLALVWRDSRLRHLTGLVAATGFLGLGVYLVAMPLLAREVYQGNAGFYAFLQLTFTIGVIIANILVIRGVGGHWAPGRLMLISLLIRGFLLAIIATALPLWALFPAVLLWGVLSGWSMVLGRTMTHEMSPRSHRGRVVSVYQLALFGGAPVGAWVCGQVVHWIDLLPAIALFGGLTVITALWMLWRSELRNV